MRPLWFRSQILETRPFFIAKPSAKSSQWIPCLVYEFRSLIIIQGTTQAWKVDGPIEFRFDFLPVISSALTKEKSCFKNDFEQRDASGKSKAANLMISPFFQKKQPFSRTARKENSSCCSKLPESCRTSLLFPVRSDFFLHFRQGECPEE